MIYEDDSHLIDDESILREKMEVYRNQALDKLTEIEKCAIFEEFDQFKYLYIEEITEEMAVNHMRELYE